MPNPFEAVWNTLKTTIDKVDEPHSPLHVIEVGDLWKYVTMVEEFIRYEEVGLNTSLNKKQLIEEELSDFMKKEGVPLSDVTSAKPESNPKEVPLGVKLTDDEISNGISFKLVLCMQACAKGQADAIRNDIGLLWLNFYTEWVAFGTTLKTLMRKRGWIKIPPYYYPPGSPVQ